MASVQAEMSSIYMPFAQSNANELNLVNLDHCYAKPWSTHPEASNAQPVRFLFMDPFPRRSTFGNKNQDKWDMIDVEVEDRQIMPVYDVNNARSMMSECERHIVLLRPDSVDMRDDWEEHIASIRTTWTVLQNRLFAKIMRVLQGDRLARLSIQDTKNEPIQRRLQIDKAAKRVKLAFANVSWDMSLILWLHNVFLENLRGQLLTSYLEILQTLRLKIPSLIQSLIDGTASKTGGLTNDTLNVLLKRTWDPVLSSIHQQKPKKLPGQALLLVISKVFSTQSPVATKRHKFWQHQLNFLGKVVNIVPINGSTKISINNFVENMVAATRSKILEVKGHYTGRPIILVGFHIGALVACQVALLEQVQAVVCLGYPTMGIHGNRGEIEDPIYSCKVPTLFVVGQHASSSCVDDLEDIREKIRVDTGLIVVGGADDHLRMARAKKKSCGVIQSVVDRCIIDEVSNFVGTTLQAEMNSSDSPEDVDILKKIPLKRKKQAVAVGSQTPGDIVKQVKSVKALKNLKQDPMLSSVGVGMPTNQASSTKSSLTKLSKSGKKSQKKYSNTLDSGTATMKRANTPTHVQPGSSKKSHGHSSLSSRNEAAVIASSPELSNLLQSIKADVNRSQSPQPSSPSIVKTPAFLPSSSPVTPASSTPQTSTSLTLSKFLLSSNIFKAEEHSQAKSVSIDLVQDTPTTSKQSSILSLTTGENITKKQEAQLLIHTKDSNQPISFPVTFTMANKLPTKSTAALVKPTSCMDSILSYPSDSKLSASLVQTTASSLVQNTSPVLASTLRTVMSSGHSAPSLAKDSLITSSRSPLASVISFGSDTVQMKETPPTTTTPATVSIDLGQLPASNNLVMKFDAPPKVSLIPTLKTTSSSCVRSSSLGDTTVSKPLKSSIVSTTEMTSLITSGVKSQSTTLPFFSSGGKIGEKNLTILSNSDLLSSLVSNSGLITLKLATPNKSTAITLTSQPPPRYSEKDETTKVSSPLDRLDHSKYTTTTRQQVTSVTLNTVTSTAVKSSLLQNLQTKYSDTGNNTGPKKTSKPPINIPIIFNPKSKAISITPFSSCLSSPATPNLTTQSSLHKTILVSSSSDSFGKKTSILNPVPVSVGNVKLTPTIAECQSSLNNQSLINHETESNAEQVSVTSPTTSQVINRTSKSVVTSYTPTSKNVLPAVASTRTRKIKTPKQYDL